MKMSKNTNKSLFLILPVLSILAVIAIGLIWIQPSIASIQDTQSKKTQEVDKKGKLEQKLTELTKLETDRTNLLAKLTNLQIALPNEKDIPLLIIHLQEVASSSDTQIVGIQLTGGKLVNDTTPGAKIGPEVALNISFEGNYEAVKTFLEKIYKGKRLINMESLSLTTGNEENQELIRGVSSITSYYQPLPAKPKDATEPIPVLTAQDETIYQKLEEYQTYTGSGTSTSSSTKPSATPNVSLEDDEATGSANR